MLDFSSLRALLKRIMVAEEQHDYNVRNRLIYMAMGRAAAQGLTVGFRLGPAEPEWPVAYLELPTLPDVSGQISWHLPQHGIPWDGHSTDEKYERIRQYIKR